MSPAHPPPVRSASMRAASISVLSALRTEADGSPAGLRRAVATVLEAASEGQKGQLYQMITRTDTGMQVAHLS
eukprot:9144467-Pyramimonas_sp.AAC.1